MKLTDENLDRLLRNLISDSNFYYSNAYSYFEDLYYTGCRSTEPLQIERWKYTNDKVILNTLKTEAIRFFDPALLSNDLMISLANNLPPYNGLTYWQLTEEFRKHIGLHPVYSGKRIADTYLFRYNRARLIFNQTNSLASVQNFFGWNSISMAESYVTQPLEYFGCTINNR